MKQKHFHFCGVAGSAMATLAILLKQSGYKVTGSDANVYPPMSTMLEEQQIDFTNGYKKENLLPHPDIVVIGNALSRGNEEVEYVLEQRLFYQSMSEVLKNTFIRGNCPIVITGTHGKTTTTSLTAHLFTYAKQDCGFFLGGKAENFPVSAQACKNKNGYFIIEGDEYDSAFFDKRSKFFHYLPELLVINNIEFDHADIFDSIEDIKKSFIFMLRQMPRTGKIFVNGDDTNALAVVKHAFCPVVRFGTNEDCEAYIHNIEVEKNSLSTTWELTYQQKTYSFTIPLLGEIYVRNATAAILNALEANIPLQTIQEGLQSFKGVRRRMNSIPTQTELLVFDDFAHHPTAIRASIHALKQAFPTAKLHVLFEPRSNTCIRNDHQDTLPTAFDEANFVYLYKLHRPQRIAPEKRLNLTQVQQTLQANQKQAYLADSLEEIQAQVQGNIQKNDIVLCMSQGDFGGLPHTLATSLIV